MSPDLNTMTFSTCFNWVMLLFEFRGKIPYRNCWIWFFIFIYSLIFILTRNSGKSVYNLTKSHQISPSHTTLYRNSLNLTIFQHISMNLTESYYIAMYIIIIISLYLTESHNISLNPSEYHHILPNFTKSHKISLHLTISCHILPNLLNLTGFN